MATNLKRSIQRHCNIYYPSLQAVCQQYSDLAPCEFIDKAGLQHFYVCPICLVDYTYIEAGKITGKDFSNDHYPPDSAGGKQKILVCKDCNSTCGHEFDFGIKDYLSFNSFSKKEVISIPGRMALEGIPGNYSTRLSWANGKLLSKTDFGKYPVLDAAFKAKSIAESPVDLKLSFRIPLVSNLYKAFLKAAYLHCFAIFGYEFALSRNAKKLVATLRGQSIHPLSNFGVYRDDSVVDKTPGLYYVSFPLK